MTSAERIGELLFKYTRKELSRAETEELSAWRKSTPKNEALFQKETDPEHIRNEMKILYEAEARAYEKFLQLHPEAPETPGFKPKTIISRIWYISKIAASAILTLGTGLYFLAIGLAPALQPGTYQANLVSIDNVEYALNDFERGYLVKRAGIDVEEKANGVLLYIIPNDSTRLKDKYVKLSTPRRGMFSMRLPDGTMVWLNADSKISYPANFSQDSILITIQGEAYFEVVPHTKVRYCIQSDSLQINTTGAHINISCYSGEPTLVSLTQGSAKVRTRSKNISTDSSEVLLSLADRSTVTMNQLESKEKKDSLTGEDLQDVVAWKNWRISFHNAPIQKIMNEIARWYDAKVIYAGDIPGKGFNLDLPRDSKFSSIVNALHQQGVHITTEKKNVTVSF